MSYDLQFIDRLRFEDRPNPVHEIQVHSFRRGMPWQRDMLYREGINTLPVYARLYRIQGHGGVDMKKWTTKLNIGDDKMYHMLAGIGIVLVGTALGLPIIITLFILIGFGVGKEVYDSLGYGTPDLWDALFTVLAGIAVIVIIIIIQQKRKQGNIYK